MSKIDNTVYEGTAEELQPLIQFVYLFIHLSSDKDYGDLFDRLEGTETGTKLRRPLYLVHAGPLFIGHSRTLRTVIAFLSNSEDDVKFYAKFDLDSLLLFAEEMIDKQLDPTATRAMAESLAA